MGNESGKESGNPPVNSPVLSNLFQTGFPTVGSEGSPPHMARMIELCGKLGLPASAANPNEPLPNVDTPFTGLKNLGATCYMATLLQTMFWTPELRQHVIGFPFDAPQRHAKNVAFHLQLLFSNMQEGTPSLNPKALVDSFGMGDSAHREQHDVQELSRVMIDCLQGFIDLYESKRDQGTGAVPPPSGYMVQQVLKFLYHGHMNDLITCKNCGHARGNPSVFYDLVLPLCSAMGEEFDRDVLGLSEIKSLDDCLTRLVNKEEIDGVQCDACNGRHAVLKGLMFVRDALPKVLSIQLGRMHYDVETNRRQKLERMIELPLTLHMDKWCAPSSSSSTSVAEMDGNDCSYYLQSVIVHRGNGYHGHYFVYVRFLVDSESQTFRWAKFNDDEVSWVTDHEVLEYVNPAQWQVDELALRAKKEEEERQQKEQQQQQQQGATSTAVAEDVVGAVTSAPTTTEATSSSSNEKNQAPTNPSTLGPREDSDTLNAVASVFPELPTETILMLPAPPARAPSLPKPSGESYYLIYRHASLPPVRGTERFLAPQYIEEVLVEQRKQRAADLAELQALKEVVAVQVRVGNIDKNLTAQLRVNKKLQEVVEPASAMTTMWIEARREHTVESLMKAVQDKVQQHNLNDKNNPIPSLPPNWKLRRFDATIGTLGGPLLALDSLVGDLLQSSTIILATEVRQWVLENLPRLENESSSAKLTVDGQPSSTATSSQPQFETEIEIQIQDPEDPLAFPFFYSVSAYSPSNVQDLISRMRTVCLGHWNRPISEEVDIVLTVLVDGVCHVRRGGLLVGRRVFLERRSAAALPSKDEEAEPTTPVTETSFASQYFAESQKMVVHVHVHQEAPHVSDLVVVAPPAAAAAAEENASKGDGIETKTATEPSSPVPQYTLRFDRRMTLRALKLEIGANILHWGDDLTQYQILPNSAKVEPRNVDSTLQTVAMFKPLLEVTFVKKPILAEGHYEAEVFVLQQSLNPIVAHATISTIAALPSNQGGPKLTIVGPQLTQEQFLRLHVSSPSSDSGLTQTAECDDNNNAEKEAGEASSLLKKWRIRLLPPGKVISMGTPLVMDTILGNMTSDHRVSTSPLRFVIEPIPQLSQETLQMLYPEGYPSKLKKSSLILHLLEWKPQEADIAASLNGPSVEIIIGKESHGEDLVAMAQLALFGIPRSGAAGTAAAETEPSGSSGPSAAAADCEDLVDVVAAKLYTLQSHDTVYNKLTWGVLAKGTRSRALSIAAYPMSVAMDDLILVRRLKARSSDEDDEWPHVSEKAKKQGTMPFYSSSSAKSTKFTLPNNNNNNDTASSQNQSNGEGTSAAADSGEQAKKKRKTDNRPAEKGIVLRAVWEFYEPTFTEAELKEGDAPAPSSSTQEGANSNAATVEGPSLPPDVDQASSLAAAEPTSGVTIDFLEYDTFQPSLHAQLGNECRVCYSEYDGGDVVCVLPCNHMFHRDCLAPWVVMHATCPSCSKSILS